MKAKLNNIAWLDDNSERIGQLHPLKLSLQEYGYNLVGILCDFDSLPEGLKRIRKESPCMIIIDQFLNISNKPTPQKGTAWAQYLREELDIPILGTTGDDRFQPDSIQEYLFIDWFNSEKLIGAECSDEIAALASGYNTLRVSRRRVNNWSSFLNPPNSQIDLLEAAIPTELKSDKHKSKPHIYSRWIWNYLLKWPGFTYDQLELATTLGLNTRGFDKIAEEFKLFKYDGVFACQSNPRWWMSDVCGFVRSKVEDGYTGSIWQVGRKFAQNNGCKPVDFSKNYNHEELKAEADCVAHKTKDFIKDDRVSINRSSTIELTDPEPPLGFERLKIVKLN